MTREETSQHEVAAIVASDLPTKAAEENRLVDETSRRVVSEDEELLRRLGQ